MNVLMLRILVTNDDGYRSEGIKALASMPSLDQLRATLIGLVQAPATKIAQLTTAPAAKLARVFNAYAEKEAA